MLYLLIVKKRVGEGQYRYKDTTEYNGNFKNNEFDGIAKMKYANGGAYHGKLKILFCICI